MYVFGLNFRQLVYRIKRTRTTRTTRRRRRTTTKRRKMKGGRRERSKKFCFVSMMKTKTQISKWKLDIWRKRSNDSAFYFLFTFLTQTQKVKLKHKQRERKKKDRKKKEKSKHKRHCCCNNNQSLGGFFFFFFFSFQGRYYYNLLSLPLTWHSTISSFLVNSHTGIELFFNYLIFCGLKNGKIYNTYFSCIFVLLSSVLFFLCRLCVQ